MALANSGPKHKACIEECVKGLISSTAVSDGRAVFTFAFPIILSLTAGDEGCQIHGILASSGTLGRELSTICRRPLNNRRHSCGMPA